MRLIDLPRDIRNIAIDRTIDYHDIIYTNHSNKYKISLNYEITELFSFSETIEGLQIWSDVW